MNLGWWPVLERLSKCKHVLLAGAGGGYDVFAATPLVVALEAARVQVSLANLSFSSLSEVQGRWLDENVVEVGAATVGPKHYFPEGVLARWWARRGAPRSVFAFRKTGVRPLTRAWRALVAELRVDAVVLVDGGTDILMRGDEAGLGTPTEDLSSVAAVSALEVPEKLVVCVGFGVDRYHGVCHAHFLENVAALSKTNAYLGVSALVQGMPEADAYLDLVAYCGHDMPWASSIVNLSIASAIEGAFGDVQRTSRTSNSELFINPLMALCWGFELEAVARRCLYLDELFDTDDVFELSARIEAFRERNRAKPWLALPM